MAVPQAPKNLFINRNANYAVVKWDKVIQDISNPPQYTNVLRYYIYKTNNPALLNWTLQATIITGDKYSDKDVFWIDFSPGNYLYRVCAENADGIGPCTVSYGIIGNPDDVITTIPCRWDVGKWDECVWGP